ncbi:pyridoxal phosphate-dependent aminotransferase [Oceanibium sediminis]|uniref:pyridoxal phosphate-dependent aminotransferase n=1 Tax=Oceanibium sediminis TaxID=2026339 RepID=UPI000DD2F27C|nr:pyridoxal phosphate-dependent aminotransferase [Oceanibium sediminis]
MKGPRFTPLIDSLPATVPFVGPEEQERIMGRPFTARLGANESVYGPAPEAIAAMAAEAAESWKYGDSLSHDLRAKLSEVHGVNPENMVIGSGIDGLLGSLVRLLVGQGTPVVTSAGAYPTFNYHVTGFGGTIHSVPYRNDAEDPDALIAKAAEVDAALIYFANPDNPMGSWHSAGRVQAMIDALPEGCVLCLDEAYCEFAPEGAVPPLDMTHPRVIRMRTFSKAHGMAGARIGYALGHEALIAAFSKVRNHFGVNRMAQAGALASLNAPDWLAHVQTEVAAARERISAIAAENGLAALPSATNFVTIDCGRDGAYAKSVLDGLIARGVFVRMPFVAPENRCIRVSAGTRADTDAFAVALRDTLAALG